MTAGPGVARRGSERPVLDSVPRTVQVGAAWSWRLLAIAAALALGVWLIAVLKVIVVPVAIAILVTVLLNPVADWLQDRLRFPRWLAAAVALVGLLVLVTGLLILASREILQGFAELAEQARGGFDQFLAWLSDGPLGLSADQLTDYLDQISTQLGENSQGLVSGALALTVTIGHVLAGTLIAIFCLYFFVLDGPRMWRWVIRLLPLGAREPVFQASRRAVLTLSSYVRTQILIAAVDAIGIGLGAALLGLPLALPLATLVFLGAFIPIVGAVLTGSVAVLVALVDQGLGAALIMLAIVIGVQQFEGNVLEPWFMSRAVALHPVAVLLVVAAGGFVAGIVGALLAVPIAATLNTFVLYLQGRDQFPELAEGGPPLQPAAG